MPNNSFDAAIDKNGEFIYEPVLNDTTVPLVSRGFMRTYGDGKATLLNLMGKNILETEKLKATGLVSLL